VFELEGTWYPRNGCVSGLVRGTMKRRLRWIGWIMVGVLGVGVNAGGDSAAVKAALKQVSKTTKGVRGIVAEVEYAEIVGKRSINGAGKLYVHLAGALRAEIAGDEPRTMLFNPPYLYIHRQADRVVEAYDVTSNPHRLGQYVMLGFVPAGSALKQRYNVQLVEDSTLDGKPMLNFLMTPKPDKSAAAAGAIARVELWVDPESGLPAQHQIVHAAGEAQLKVRYLSMSRDDTLSDSLFRPDWPAGTTVIRK
jgi:outer membrane lipoprotein-sorting protein